MSFSDAAKLQNVEVDHDSKQIYFKKDDSLIVLDFANGIL